MGGGARANQVGHKVPDAKALTDDAERAALGDAQGHAARAGQAADSGDVERARTEWREAAEGFTRLADRHRTSEWRLVYRRAAAECFLRAGDPEGAAREADRLRGDPAADATTRAEGARLAAGALQLAALEQVRAGRLDPVRIGSRKELRPRPLAEPWKRFVEAADAYAAACPPGAEHDAAALALFAAQVEYSHDNVEDAQARLEVIFERWPATGAAAEGVGTYLQTFLARKDAAGHAQAMERARAMLERNRESVESTARAPGATGEEKAVPEKVAAALKQLGAEKDRLVYVRGMELLRGGKPAEAVTAFEHYLRESPDGSDAPNALYNQAVAHALAKEPRQAESARERLLQEYPDAPEAGVATVALATSRLGAGDTTRAVQLYERYLQKWPDGDQRCLALGNLGSALEQADRRLEAAARYRTFGLDERCAKADPNIASRALYNAGVLYYNARRRADAKAVWTELVNMNGVSDAVSRSQIEQARERLNLLK